MIVVTGCCTAATVKDSDKAIDEVSVKSTDVIGVENPDHLRPEQIRQALLNLVESAVVEAAIDLQKRRMDNKKGEKKCQCP